MTIPTAIVAVLLLNAFSRTPPVTSTHSLKPRLLPSSIQRMHSLQMNCFDVLLWIGIPIFIKPHNLPHAYRVKPQIFSLTLLWSNMFLPTTPLQGSCNSSQTPFCNTYPRISVSCCWLISFSLWNYFNLVPYVQILTTPQGSAPLPFPSWIPSWFFSYNSNFPLLGNGGTFYLCFSNSTYHCFLLLQITLCPSQLVSSAFWRHRSAFLFVYFKITSIST